MANEEYIEQAVRCTRHGCFYNVGLVLGLLIDFTLVFTVIYLLAKPDKK